MRRTGHLLSSSSPSRVAARRTVVLACVYALFLTSGVSAAAPQRVVSFSPALTEMLFDMGFGDRVVGVTSYCMLPSGEKRPAVGDQFNFATEHILAVRPDVVFVQGDAKRMAALAAVAPNVKVVPVRIESLAEIPEAMKLLARTLGDPGRGETAATTFENTLQTARASTDGSPLRVLFVMGTDRPSVAAEGSFIHDLIEYLGATNAADEIPGAPRWREATIESIVASRPDVLICHETRVEQVDAAKAYWLRWGELSAAKQGRVHVVSDRRWTIPSGRLAKRASDLAAMLAGPHEEPVAGARWTLAEAQLLRLLAVAAVGAALACGGAALQGLLRNPLAEPYLLGISSGAGVGVLLGLAITSSWAFGAQMTTPALAFVGALLASAAVYVIARKGGVLDPHTIILAGVIVNALNAAVMLSIYLYIDPYRIPDFARWSMGQVPEMLEPTTLLVCGLLIVAGWIGMILRGSALNVLSLGDAVADSSGVSVGRLRSEVFVGASLMTAASVALVGPIGFVGLIVPHLCRRLVGSEHRRLLLASGILGAVLLVGAEILCRRAGAWFGVGKIPVGVICALTGGPFFLMLLRRRA